jgi:hypothetical protein
MKRNPVLAGVLSLLVPGLGQIYAGQKNRGAAILVGAIVVANLNIIILPLIAMANPNGPVGVPANVVAWRYWIPRIGHDAASLWSIVYWIWAVVDAIASVRSGHGVQVVKTRPRSRK